MANPRHQDKNEILKNESQDRLKTKHSPDFFVIPVSDGPVTSETILNC